MEEIAKNITEVIGKHLAEEMEDTPLTILIKKVQKEDITKHIFLEYVSHRWDKVKEG